MKTMFLVLLSIIFCNVNTIAQNLNEKLYEAVVKNDVTLVKQLINEKADVNFIKSEGPWMKVNLLITAVNNKNLDIVKILIENKVNINWRDGFNSTAIMYAANSGNLEIVNYLLLHGANVNDNDGTGNSVLTAAKESKNEEVIKLIEDKLRVNKK